MSIFRKTLSCAVLAALGTWASSVFMMMSPSRKPSAKAPLHPNRHPPPMLPERNPHSLRM